MYQFFRHKYPDLDKSLPAEVTDHSHAICEAGMKGEDELCKKTLDCFVRIYGSEIGDYCLKLNP